MNIKTKLITAIFGTLVVVVVLVIGITSMLRSPEENSKDLPDASIAGTPNKETEDAKEEDKQAKEQAEQGDTEQERKEKEQEEQTEQQEQKEQEELTPEELTPKESTEEINEQKQEAEGAMTYNYANENYQITMPESWRETAIVENNTNGIFVHQKSSNQVNEGGMLFGIMMTDDIEDMYGMPDYTKLAEQDGIIFFMINPTDVQFVDEYQEEYNSMMKAVPRIADSFVVISTKYKREQGETPNHEAEQDGAYILPTSNTAYLTEDNVKSLNIEQLRIARNEIFARKGYIFTSQEMKDYFQKKSWYKGSVSADSFRNDMLNDFELANIRLIESFEDKLG